MYNFSNHYCFKLWELASPAEDKYIHAFAWREKPALLERAWSSATAKVSYAEEKILYDQIVLAAEAQERYRKQCLEKRQDIKRPPGIGSWINNGDWGMDIGSHADTKPVELGVCSVSGCQSTVHGPRFKVCAHHLVNTAQQKEVVKASLRRLDLMPKENQSREEWRRELIDYCRNHIGKINKG